MTQKKKRIVIALGGNALGNTLPEQMQAVKTTAKAIVDLIQEGCEVIVSHGNGPQVGMINHAMAALSREDVNQPNTPLSVCVAMSQAYIGYDLQNALREEMHNRDIFDIPVATMVTQVRVDPEDPAFKRPTKPIGHFMTKEQAEHAAKEYGYIVKEDAGRGWRRVVASPQPREIIEIGAIKTLVDSGQLVIACGGGGIPVTHQGNHLKGASAVIDKDFVSELLAEDLHADYLIILTAVENAAINFSTPEVTVPHRISPPKKLGPIWNKGTLPPARCSESTGGQSNSPNRDRGRTALITLLQKAKEGILGKTGTRIHQP
mgnify:CR=1 FL=1